MGKFASFRRLLVLGLILAILVGAGWLLGKTGILHFPFLPNTGTDNIPPVSPTPFEGANAYWSHGDELGTQYGWEVDQNTANYHEPTLAELDSIYKGARQAKDARDLEAFKNFATTKVTYILEHTLQYKQLNKDNMPILFVIPPSGPEYFAQYAPFSNNLIYPTDLAIYTPLSLEPFQYNADPTAIVVDQTTQTEYKLLDPVYQHYYALYYRIEGLDQNRFTKLRPEEAWEGRIYFAWDHGKWRYNTEDWFLLPVSGTATGDVDIAASKTTEINKTDADSDVYAPLNITIKAGEKIKWVGITGIIGSTGSSGGLSPWNSSRLINQSFEKVFTQKGTYQYSIKKWEFELHGEITIN